MRLYARYALAYVLWAVSIVLGAGVGLLARDAVMNALAIGSSMGRAQPNPSQAFYSGLQIRAGDTWSYLLLGIALVLLVVFVEHWYQTGVPLRRLLPRFLLVTAAELAVLFAAHGLYFVLARSAGLIPWSSASVPIFELAATALFVGLYAWRSRQPTRTEIG